MADAPPATSSPTACGSAAVAASQRDSRGLTAAAALHRLGLLPLNGDVAAPLRVTVAGADRTEGVFSAAAAAALFAPLAASATSSGVPALRLLLLGPSVPPRPPRAGQFTVTPAGVVRSLDDPPSDDDSASVPPSSASSPLPPLALRVVMAHGLLCDAASPPVFAPGCDYDSDGDEAPNAPPDAVFAFNAGVWGYDAWASGIAACCATLGAPVVVTSYRMEECVEDARALRRAGLALAWGPEANPHASRAPWAPAGAQGDGVTRFENAAWLCAVSKNSRWAPPPGGDASDDDSSDDDGSA